MLDCAGRVPPFFELGVFFCIGLTVFLDMQTGLQFECQNSSALPGNLGKRPDSEFACPPEQGNHGESLHENGKRYHGKADGDDRFAFRHLRRKPQCECERQRTAQAASNQRLLMPG